LQGLENFRAYTDCSLSEVIQTVTHNPSELYHLKNSGEIAAGNSANLVQLKAEEKIEVEKTIIKGELVYEKV
jgi:adenine deaminase